ncbi:MAG: PQQ-binding-like beta-propeller repeat protein [Phycisphaeraceae bacterium]
MGLNRVVRRLFFAGLCSCVPVAAWGQNQNVTVNEQPTAEQRLGEVNELRRAGRYDAAAELTQELIEQSQLKLVGIGEGRYTDAERWCREELLRDPALREAYRERYTALATRSLDQAMASDRPVAALDQTVRQYIATEPALEAGLQLAGRLLESGDAAAAAALLDELKRHPDRDKQLARVLMLQGAAAVYTQDAEALDQSRERLAEIGQQALADGLAQLAASMGPGALVDKPGLLDAGIKPEELRLSLWDQPLSEADRAAAWLRTEGVMPVVTPSMALMNNGRQVIALDRASGQRLWGYPSDDSADLVRPVGGGERWYDTRGVAVGRDAVCAVIGECYAIAEARNPYVYPNKLVCIDELTGQLRWERKAGELKEDEPTQGDDRRLGRANLQLTHFVGTPIIANGQVFVLLRRGTEQAAGTQTTWLLAFDLEDGSLRWFRHLAMSQLSFRSDAEELTPQFLLYGETLYITDNIATVAALDTRSGGYKWLRVLPVGSGQSKRLSVETAGMVSPPVLTHAGLLVPIALSGDRLVLLDPSDGTTLQDFKNDPHLGGAQYLMDAGDGAVVVSLKSVAYWNARDAKVQWTFDLDAQERAKGMGDVTKRYVIVPTNQRLVVLDRADGSLLEAVGFSGGNLTVSEGEVLATQAGRLYSYTSWDRAYRRLVRRVEQQPGDPTAGLALASLALRIGGKRDAVMQGVGYALAAIDLQTPERAELTRQVVIDQLRDLAIQPGAMDDATRRQLYDRLALATNTAAQEAAYHLDAGRFYAGLGEAGRAVQHFQAVVADPAFASQPYKREGTTRSAGAVAQDQILKLIQTHGREVYARYDALARTRLAELKAAGQADAAALALIARRYPLSLAAVEALIEAGRSFEQQGDAIGAAALYQQAVVRSGQSRQRQLAVGQLLNHYLANQRADAAEALLDREARLNPDLYPIDGDKPLPPAAWRQRVEALDVQPGERPRLAEALGTPFMLEGRLVAPAKGVDAHALGRNLLLVHPDHTLTCHGPDNPRQPRWTAELPVQARSWLVLAYGERQVLLWAADAGVVAALDPATGETLWATALGFGLDPSAEAPLPGEEQDHTLFAVTDTVVCFGRRIDAKLVAIDRAAGGVLWRSKPTMTRLTALDADHWTLAAAGRIGQAELASEGNLAVLNLFTGEPQTQTPELRLALSPLAMRLDAGRAIVVGENKVAAVDTRSGVEVWGYAVADGTLGPDLALGQTLLAVATKQGTVHLLDHTRAGRVAGQVVVRGASDASGVALQAMHHDLWVTAGRGLYRLGPSPAVRWSDSVSLPYKQPVLGLIGETRVAMIAVTDPTQDANRLDQPKSFGLFLLDREGGRLLNRYTLGPIDDEALQGLLDAGAAQLFGRGLAVPVGAKTMIVPGGDG